MDGLSIPLFLAGETVTIGIAVQQTPLPLTITPLWQGVWRREMPDEKGRKNGLWQQDTTPPPRPVFSPPSQTMHRPAGRRVQDNLSLKSLTLFPPVHFDPAILWAIGLLPFWFSFGLYSAVTRTRREYILREGYPTAARAAIYECGHPQTVAWQAGRTLILHFTSRNLGGQKAKGDDDDETKHIEWIPNPSPFLLSDLLRMPSTGQSQPVPKRAKEPTAAIPRRRSFGAQSRLQEGLEELMGDISRVRTHAQSTVLLVCWIFLSDRRSRGLLESKRNPEQEDNFYYYK